jgi:hypothetical protein
MSEAGFDARNVGDLAAVSSEQQGENLTQIEPVTLNITDQMLQELNQLLDSLYNDNLSDEDKESTLASVKEIFEQTVPEGGLVNVTA